MKDEIKEILLKISESINNHETIYLNEFERKNLLFYIHKLEMKETDENLKTKIEELEQENENLKDLKYFTTDEIYKELGKRLQNDADVSNELADECNEKQERIDKAIEYIGNGNIGIPRKTRDKFITILKGEDKNDNR